MANSKVDFALKSVRERLPNYITIRGNSGDEVELEDIRSISDEDLDYLSQAIANTNDMESIIMNYTITEAQFPVISRALQDNLSLRKIEISATNLQSKITCFHRVLTKPGAVITKLAFFDTKLTSKDIQLLGEGLKNNNTLVTLDLMCNDFGVEGCMYLSEALKQHKTIKYLSLPGNSISVEGAKYIASILKVNTSLTSLDLATNDLDAESVKHLADCLYGNTTLKHLIIYNNRIRDEGCVHLRHILDHCPSLIELDIAVNGISAVGFSELSKSLRRNNSLLTLLASVNLGEGALNVETGYEHLCSALEENTSLTALDLSRNNSLELSLPYLEKMLRVNRSLLELKLNSVSKWKLTEGSPTPEIVDALHRNNQARREQVKNLIMVLLNMGRQAATFEKFPLEIWLTIFKHFSVPGILNFEQPVRFVLLNAKNIIVELTSGSEITFVVSDEAELRLDIVKNTK